MSTTDRRPGGTAIVEEIRAAYRSVGITLDQPAAFGTYYRLLCAACGQMVGNVGDKLLPGMARELVDQQLDLYAAGLLGCPCGHQQERARSLEHSEGASAAPSDASPWRGLRRQSRRSKRGYSDTPPGGPRP
jgi:hypothetical protein